MSCQNKEHQSQGFQKKKKKKNRQADTVSPCGLGTWEGRHWGREAFFYYFFFFFWFLGSNLTAYGSSQARGRIYSCWPTPPPHQRRIRGASAAQGNAGSPTHPTRPGIEPTSSWILVRSISTGPQRERLIFIFNVDILHFSPTCPFLEQLKQRYKVRFLGHKRLF